MGIRRDIKTLNKLIGKYDNLQRGVLTELAIIDDISSVEYMCLSSINRDYSLKIKVLEDVIRDIKSTNIDYNININDIKCSTNVLNILNSEYNIKDDSNNICNTDNSNIYNDFNTDTKDKDINNYEYKLTNLDIKNNSKEGLVCTFKGYDYKDLYGYDINNSFYDALNKRIERLIIRLIEDKGITVFLTDGSLGFNKMVFYIVNKLKDTYPNIKNNLAIPFSSQDSNWSDSNKRDYAFMKDNADSIVYVDELEKYKVCDIPNGIYHKDKLKKCDYYRIDNCDALILLYNGEQKGHIHSCKVYAHSLGVERIMTLNISK